MDAQIFMDVLLGTCKAPFFLSLWHFRYERLGFHRTKFIHLFNFGLEKTGKEPATDPTRPPHVGQEEASHA